ncbi:hypothetical protein [Candidatus Amarolinea dominans]|uniref:hypothetical protein n=1 Tax=Candidatus Amarolinea dominans TaxID=3140696 RepID=UPI001DF634E9|nr:hypothetical protein [Anaerolineae bacterium]
MIRKHLLTVLFVAVGVILLAGLAVQLPDSQARAQEEQPGAVLAPAVDVSGSFTYQGSLQQNSAPFSGSCDFQFKLFSAAAGGAQIGATQARNGQPVSQGRFASELDFGVSAFDGQARWLEIAVRCPSGVGGFTTLSPRQSLTASPYALSLQPGAVIVGSVGQVQNAASGILNLTNNGTGPGITVNSAVRGVYVGTGSIAGMQVDNADLGVFVVNARNGFLVQTATENGVQVNSALNGIRVLSANTGLRVDSANLIGVDVQSAGGAGVFVNAAGNNGLQVGSAGNNGLQVQSAGGNGVQVDAAVNSGFSVNTAGQDGLFVCATGSLTTCAPNNSLHNGVEIANAEHYGLWVTNAGADGVFIDNAGDTGLEVWQAGGDGIDIVSAADDGVQVRSAINGLHVQSVTRGVQVDSTTTYGLRVESAGSAGVSVSNAATAGIEIGSVRDGVVVWSPSNWAGFFNGPISSTSCTGCLIATFGINTGATALAPGDIVAVQGTRPGDTIGQPMFMEVGQATQAGAPVVGVVYGRGELVSIVGPDGTTVTQLVPRQGAAQTGDYVHIIIYGPVQVKASALGAAITVGNKLAVDSSGAARGLETVEVGGVRLAESAPTIGMALENLDASKAGLIWVLVNPQ